MKGSNQKQLMYLGFGNFVPIISEKIVPTTKVPFSGLAFPSPLEFLIRRIEGQFGSSIGSYFRFLKFQVNFNIILAILK